MTWATETSRVTGVWFKPFNVLWYSTTHILTSPSFPPSSSCNKSPFTRFQSETSASCQKQSVSLGASSISTFCTGLQSFRAERHVSLRRSATGFEGGVLLFGGRVTGVTQSAVTSNTAVLQRQGNAAHTTGWRGAKTFCYVLSVLNSPQESLVGILVYQSEPVSGKKKHFLRTPFWRAQLPRSNTLQLPADASTAQIQSSLYLQSEEGSNQGQLNLFEDTLSEDERRNVFKSPNKVYLIW